MRKFAVLLALTSGTLAFAGVSVSAPANGSSVSPTVQYVAQATSNCAAVVSSIGIYSMPGTLAYSTTGGRLNTVLTFSPGDYQTVVQAWDNCGGVSKTPVLIHVSSAATEVQVTAPTNNATVAPQVQFVASATSTCAHSWPLSTFWVSHSKEASENHSTVPEIAWIEPRAPKAAGRPK